MVGGRGRGVECVSGVRVVECASGVRERGGVCEWCEGEWWSV